MPDQREIRWGKQRKGYNPDPESNAFYLLVDDAKRSGYIRTGYQFVSGGDVLRTVQLDRFCRDVLNAKLIIGESTGYINGIRFSNIEDCLHFKLRV